MLTTIVPKYTAIENVVIGFVYNGLSAYAIHFFAQSLALVNGNGVHGACACVCE